MIAIAESSHKSFGQEPNPRCLLPSIEGMIQQGWRTLLDLLFPRACLLCRNLVTEERYSSICAACEKEFQPIQLGCQRCGAPNPRNDQETLVSRRIEGPGFTNSVSKAKRPRSHCRFCKGQSWEFGRVWCFTTYQSKAARAARLIKDPRCESLTRDLGQLLADWLHQQEEFRETHYDCIVPIPQHWLRRLSHRYNQAATLGDRLASRLQLPCRETILRRSRWTHKQGTKTILERRENLLGAFQATDRKSVEFRSFLLIDDVMTSGATLHEAAKALRNSGARRVDAVVFARGINASKVPARHESGDQFASNLSQESTLRDFTSPSSEAIRRKIH